MTITFNKKYANCSSEISDKNNNRVIPFDLNEFAQRHLLINAHSFLIIPNGGSGDCLFKAITQSIQCLDEEEHLIIRKSIINHLLKDDDVWKKYEEAIEVQHITGNRCLSDRWKIDPKSTYEFYMREPGVLGSLTELAVASKLYNFDFATIQEYTSNQGVKTYRVENCGERSGESVPKFHFLFTGSFECGHWEFLRPLPGPPEELEDGTYPGETKIVIRGKETGLQQWLFEKGQMGLRTEYQRQRSEKNSIHPFSWNVFNYEPDGSIIFGGNKYWIDPLSYTDLYSVIGEISEGRMGPPNVIWSKLHELRKNHFSSTCMKLISQPHSHGFTAEAIEYCTIAAQGNLLDLLTYADIENFSFSLFMLIEGQLHEARFIHVDRWDKETERIRYFFLCHRISSKTNLVVASWFHLVTSKSQLIRDDDEENYQTTYSDESAPKPKIRKCSPTKIKKVEKKRSESESSSERNRQFQRHERSNRKNSNESSESHLNYYSYSYFSSLRSESDSDHFEQETNRNSINNGDNENCRNGRERKLKPHNRFKVQNCKEARNSPLESNEIESERTERNSQRKNFKQMIKKGPIEFQIESGDPYSGEKESSHVTLNQVPIHKQTSTETTEKLESPCKKDVKRNSGFFPGIQKSIKSLRNLISKKMFELFSSGRSKSNEIRKDGVITLKGRKIEYTSENDSISYQTLQDSLTSFQIERQTKANLTHLVGRIEKHVTEDSNFKDFKQSKNWEIDKSPQKMGQIRQREIGHIKSTRLKSRKSQKITPIDHDC